MQGSFDLRDAVKRLHRQGVSVVGRLVAFRDPLYAKAAWADGRPAPTLLVETDPGAGITDEHVTQLLDWKLALSR